jgi:hypothetical protein
MPNKYDDTFLSAQKGLHLNKLLKSRIAANASAPKSTKLSEIASDFFQTTADHRRAVEHRRIHSSAHLPDSSGLPGKWRPLPYLKYAVSNLFKAIPEPFETQEKQATAASALGEIIDRNILAAGGNLNRVDVTKATYLAAKTVNDSISALDASLRVFLSHVRVSRKFCPMEKMEAAHQQLAHTRETFARFPEYTKTFPTLEPDEITAPWGYMFHRNSLERNLERYIDQIGEFQKDFNEFDVMAEHQKLWKSRGLAAQNSGLQEEAKLCAEVAEQFDADYFGTLDRAWAEKSVGTYAP